MAHYAVGRFERSQSGSPYQFVCKRVYPEGPYALLDIKRRRVAAPKTGVVHLFELEDWHSIDQRSQYVVKIIASLDQIAQHLREALKGAEWEMVQEHGRRKIQIVGKVLKTEYGYFVPTYHNGLSAFGPGQDVDPCITFESCPVSQENPYGEALGTLMAQGFLGCLDPVELKRAHDAGIAKQDLGDLMAEKMARR
jgi:hypothetical protein